MVSSVIDLLHRTLFNIEATTVVTLYRLKVTLLFLQCRDTADTGNTRNTADTENTRDTADTENTRDAVDTENTRDAGDTNEHQRHWRR